jgi:hypothetical protein
VNLMPGEEAIRSAVAEWPRWCREDWWGKKLAAVRLQFASADPAAAWRNAGRLRTFEEYSMLANPVHRGEKRRRGSMEQPRPTDQPRGAHLVGSVPLGSAEEVFRTASAKLGAHLRRIPDGETGDRSRWVGWQGFAFKRLPQFELVKPAPGQYPPTPRFRPRAGTDLAGVSFGNLGYADEALRSFEVFEALRDQRVIHPGVRFQVSIPTPLAPVMMFVVDGAQAELEPLYEERMLAELRRILDGIPHHLLAVQWDVCIEVWLWERWLSAPFEDVEREVLARLARLAAAVPDAVELGFHLCYGDYQHEHFKQPADARILVEMAGGILAGVQRPVQWLHLPVPIDRTDDGYFRPMEGLTGLDRTALFLGLVHFRGGVEGTRARVRTALGHVAAFGVAAECGLGRRPPERGGAPETLAALLETHAASSHPVFD